MVECLEIAKNAASASRLARKDGFSFYAGGTEICRLGSAVRNKKFVSLKKTGLEGIAKGTIEFDGKTVNCLKIGAMCTFTDLLKSEDVPDYLKEAARFCSSMPKRNMATIGGNIMCNRDDSYLVSALVASRVLAEVMIGGKTAVIEIDNLLSQLKGSHDVLLLSIYVRLCSRKVFLKRFANTAASHAVLTVAFGAYNHDGEVKHPVFAASIKGTGTVRVKCAEKLLAGKNMPGAADVESAIKDCTKLKFKTDIFGSAEYKQYLLAVSCADLYKEFVEAK